MSDYYRTEEEQAELVKKWWDQYGWVTIIGIVIAILLIVGWHYHKRHQASTSAEASLLYSQMLQAGSHDDKLAQSNAKLLMDKYRRTPYATLASLWLAKDAVTNHDLNAAAQHLQWTLKYGKKGAWHDLAATRLARVYLAQKKPQQALNLLNELPANSIYAALILQVKGDAYVDLKKDMLATQAYQQALKGLPSSSADYLDVQKKLANLPKLTN